MIVCEGLTLPPYENNIKPWINDKLSLLMTVCEGLTLPQIQNLSVRLLRVQKLKLTGQYQIKDWKLSLKLAHVQVFWLKSVCEGLTLPRNIIIYCFS